MGFSKAFREGLDDAVAKTRWRMGTHLQSHLLPHPEESGATRADLSKSLVVLHDCLENFVTEIVNCLEAELGRGNARGKTSGASTRPAVARRAPRRRRRGHRIASGAASRK